MIQYSIDTNVLLRYYLKDHLQHFKKAKQYLEQAEKQKMVLILMPFIVLELEYVLRKVYNLKRERRNQILQNLVKAQTLHIVDRSILNEAIELYSQKNIDLTDILLYIYSQQNHATVLSFDKDFRKLK